MKQLLFLLFFPCLALAQYPNNGNQKITLGEQTTADGLIWRGVAADTTLTAKSDTAAYFVLDTVNKKLYFYKISSTPKWNEISGSGGGGSIIDTTTMLLPYYRAGRNGIIQAADVPTLNQNTTGSAATLTTARNIRTNLASAFGANFDGSANITPGVTGVLGAGNGGTGASNFGSPNRIPFVSSSGSLTTDTFFAYNGTTQRLGVGVPNPTEKLHVDGNGLFTGSMSLGTPLTVANGGTGSGTQNFVDLTTTQSVGGAKTFTNETHVNNNLRVNSKTLFVDATLNRVAIGHDTTNSSFYKLDIRDTNPLNFSALYTGTSTTGTTSLAIQTQSNNAFLNGRYITVTQNASTHTGTLYGDSRASMALIEAYLPSVIMIGTSASAPIKFATNGTVRQIIGATGVITFSSLIGSGSRTVNAAADGSLSASSSILIKENVENINYGLSDVLKLKPVIFNYIDKEKWGEGKDLGFIAEDVMNVIPEATGVMNNSDIYFDLQKLIPVLTKAIQEQQAQIEALKQRIIILENK